MSRRKAVRWIKCIRRLIALGSRKRTKRAALSRTDGICPEWRASGSIVIESQRAYRAPASLLLALALFCSQRWFFLWPRNRANVILFSRSTGYATLCHATPRHVAFAPRRPVRFCIFPRTVSYGGRLVRGGRPPNPSSEWKGERPREGLCGCKAVIRHNTEPFSRDHFCVDVRGHRAVFKLSYCVYSGRQTATSRPLASQRFFHFIANSALEHCSNVTNLRHAADVRSNDKNRRLPDARIVIYACIS